MVTTPAPTGAAAASLDEAVSPGVICSASTTSHFVRDKLDQKEGRKTEREKMINEELSELQQ